MQSRVRCGVAGVGHLGEHHARLYGLLPEGVLVGVYDVDAKRAREVAGRYGCVAFGSLEALGEACDAVSVVVPTPLHMSVAVSLMRAGCHVLIEKPLCTSLPEAWQIVQVAKEAGVCVQVGHVEHFNPVMAFLEKTVQSPRFLQSERLSPFTARATQVGVVLDLMIHDIGIVLELVPSKVVDVEAIGVCVLSETEDLAHARLRFEDGCIATLNASRVSLKKIRKLRVFQENTYLSLDFIAQEGYLLRKEDEGLHQEQIPLEKAEPLAVELEAFLRCIRQKTSPRVGLGLGTYALSLALEITEKIRVSGEKG